MDQLTSDLLTNWGLNEYVKAFSDGKVDAGILRLLSDDEITQLIPIPGDRARFKVNLANWKEQINTLNTSENLDSTPNLPTLSILGSEDLVGDYYTSFGSLLNDPLMRTHSSQQPPEHTQPQYSQLQSRQPQRDQSSQSESNQLQPDQPQCSHTRETSTPIFEELRNDDSNTSGYVLRTLQSTLDGKSILAQGQSTGKLDDTQRNLLVKLLISPLFEKDRNRQFSNKQLLDWSLEIQEIFFKESAALYYTPYVSANVRNAARNASGKLLRFVYNKRRQLRERNIIEGSSRSRSTSKTSSSASTACSPIERLAESTDAEQLNEQLTWLKNSIEPWHLVEEKWSATANYRLRLNYEGHGTLQEYFNEYPVLKRPAGYSLLLKDFKVLYEDKTDGLYNNIVILREKIIKLARKKATTIKDKDIKANINNYLAAVSDPPEATPDPDALNNASLLLLAYLTSSVPLKDKKKSPWRPSKSEVRDGFITQIASDSELESSIISRKSKLERYGKTLQPFVVFVGTGITRISHCYVVVGDTYYVFDKLLTAVDACFKIIHATGAKYQEESFVIWMVIQKAFYKITTVHDKELTTVNSLLVDLDLTDNL